MSFSEAVLLAVVQGLTEFLPVSSSGHLALAQHFLGLVPPVEFDILVHLGTLLAVIWFFRDRLRDLWQTRKEKPTRQYLGIIFLASLPAAIVGLILKPFLAVFFGSLKLVAVGLLLTGLILLLSGRKQPEKARQLTLGRGLGVGLGQALALLPGVSRSGSTIGLGLGLGLLPAQAFEFSFLLAIPATLGAVCLSLTELLALDGQLINAFMGLVVSALTGWLALSVLKKVLVQGRLRIFGGYCLLVALLVLLTSL